MVSECQNQILILYHPENYSLIKYSGDGVWHRSKENKNKRYKHCRIVAKDISLNLFVKGNLSFNLFAKKLNAFK
ncbi:hypothetical protein BLOT_013792 [Blomia tropicalis]|nr:hypothetical protein BLOT_013792 [Blomia tropicalis]